MRIAELTASAERFAAELAVRPSAPVHKLQSELLLARRLLVIARLNVTRGRRPFSTRARSEQMSPALPTSRIGAKRQRNCRVRGRRIVRHISGAARSADPMPMAEIIVLRPERAHFADFDTRLARARGTA